MIGAFLATFARSLFLQTLWNFERMQNAGFAFSMAPLLRKVYVRRDFYLRALRRNLNFFNTHPYFGPIVMGVVYSKEKARGGETAEPDPTLAVLKDSMGGAFGAIGDHVIWGTWRPFCAILALCAGILIAFPSSRISMRPNFFDPLSAGICAKWWIAGFLGMFNSVHLWIRWRGLHKAITEGPAVVQWVKSLHLQAWAAQMRRLGLLLLAAMAMLYLSHWTSSELLIWMVAVLLGTMILKRWAVTGTAIFYTVCAVAYAMTYLELHWP